MARQSIAGWVEEMISALVHWPTGPVRLRWVPQPKNCVEPVTAVHYFCFWDEQIVLVDVAGRGVSIPGGHIVTGESLLDGLQRELAEEACITVDSPLLLGAVECDHSENLAFGPGLGYPQLASQLLYAAAVNRIRPFVAKYETSRRIFVPALKCPEQFTEWDAVIQAAFDGALAWMAG